MEATNLHRYSRLGIFSDTDELVALTEFGGALRLAGELNKDESLSRVRPVELRIQYK